jgi:serine/threonine protein kinase
MQHHYGQGLPSGYRLDGYRIEAVLGQGGFGITYKTLDTQSGRQLAVKEYFPAASAMRRQGVQVGPRSAAFREEFEYGLQRFRNEADVLGGLDHCNIVRVWRRLDVNDTAYIVMNFEDGETLERLLAGYPSGIPEPVIVTLFRGIVEGLTLVHGTGHLHRDLAPDNIIIRRDDVPVIVDFGAARFSYGQKSRSLEAIVKCGYSPPEQYMLEYSRQGPWTDIYALGAIAYRCIGGPTPPSSIERQSAVADERSDPLVPPSVIGRRRYSPALLLAIGQALQLSPGQRPASAAAWFAMFAHAPIMPTHAVIPAEPNRGSQGLIGLLCKLFSVRGGAMEVARTGWWTLTGTDSGGAPIRVEISEDALRRHQGRLVIGRHETQSNVIIPDHTISRCHALLLLDERGLHIEDANSRNGTWVNGRRLGASSGRIAVDDAARIILGGVHLTLQVGRSDSAARQ